MKALTFYHVGHWCYRRGIPFVPKLLQHLMFLSYNSSIPMSAEIGEGTRYSATAGWGLSSTADAGTANNVMIGQQVMIGGRSRIWGVPVVGDRCFFGAGAKILGPVRIGPESVVGANAVVVHDVPPRSVVAGVPARIIRKDINIDDYMDESL